MRLTKARRRVWEVVAEADRPLNGREVAAILEKDVGQVKKQLRLLARAGVMDRKMSVYTTATGHKQYVYSTDQPPMLIMRRKVLAFIAEAGCAVDAAAIAQGLGLDETTVGHHALRLYEQELVGRQSVGISTGGFRFMYMPKNWSGEQIVKVEPKPKPKPDRPHYNSILDPWWGDIREAIEDNWKKWGSVCT
jgi:predicted transcriptional regulator